MQHDHDASRFPSRFDRNGDSINIKDSARARTAPSVKITRHPRRRRANMGPQKKKEGRGRRGGGGGGGGGGERPNGILQIISRAEGRGKGRAG